ncbi:MAG: hypothetical protein ACK5S6_00960, partial [bacterium]
PFQEATAEATSAALPGTSMRDTATGYSRVTLWTSSGDAARADPGTETSEPAVPRDPTRSVRRSRRFGAFIA